MKFYDLCYNKCSKDILMEVLMAYDLTGKLVVAISSRALFDLELENSIFENEGIDAYKRYQIEHEDEILSKGTAFDLVKGLLAINEKVGQPLVEVMILSRNTPETGLRVFNSIDAYGLDITRAAFTGGVELSRYLSSFQVSLFLSKNANDVQKAINQGFAAAIIDNKPEGFSPDDNEIRIAFDADAVIFSDESERIYQEEGLEAFEAHEREFVNERMEEGPFGKFIKVLSDIKRVDPSLIRIAIVTARNNPAHKRVIYTLRDWHVTVDEAYFLGGVEKREVLRAFNPHIFFDDHDKHIGPASEFIPSGKVPWKEQ